MDIFKKLENINHFRDTGCHGGRPLKKVNIEYIEKLYGKTWI